MHEDSGQTATEHTSQLDETEAFVVRLADAARAGRRVMQAAGKVLADDTLTTIDRTTLDELTAALHAAHAAYDAAPVPR